MTKEKKELVLKDLCARLPHGLKLRYVEDLVIKKVSHTITLNNVYLEHIINGDADIKPYLRSMSSMTDDEALEYLGMLNDIDKSGLMNQNFITKVVDWLDKKMFDHRGLIPKGLALEASKGMYQ